MKIQQLDHNFPFGTKLTASKIKECVDLGYDNGYCTFAKVDTQDLLTTKMFLIKGQLQFYGSGRCNEVVPH